MRATHRLYESAVIFDDPWAVSLIDPLWRLMCKSRLLTRYVFGHRLAYLRPIQGTVLCRARFAEDALEAACRNGVTDYVIMGAGLDSFALRRGGALSGLSVWELDAPGTQQRKQSIVKKIHPGPLQNVHYIPLDFEKENFLGALRSGGLTAGTSTFFSILGLSYYIAQSALVEMLATIASGFGRGTQLVMDIRVPRNCMPESERLAYDTVGKFTAQRGERLITQIHPDRFVEVARSLGFDVLDSVSPEEQFERYFQGREDGLSPTPEIWLFHLAMP
ncbi:transferase [Pseudomonas syringae pv. actinidiae ICMP 18708]|nr:transferase [Pseudomonas syringae pv. actinidiae ICMP 18884]AOE57175.1 transferase [Pseudomonas syringae pv. actinidiae ICMP 18708]APP98133.1 transferase [Pseudomonas syringae pv. actinidiae]EPM77271.1 transferase [Pseudomonas syringae pv. actinidiae ICMP 18886]EPN63999.1 transferase [Pseudomonas syringae pv. actinidiae ICMP 19079]EPN71771.1 transferase [Pseudomonas syringae pv. actinidiae ICMP 19101]EPN77018.1 transferase [Pseudomonas syringae pv. actinidiae ICMP 19097]EPN79927.1 transfe